MTVNRLPLFLPGVTRRNQVQTILAHKPSNTFEKKKIYRSHADSHHVIAVTAVLRRFKVRNLAQFQLPFPGERFKEHIGGVAKRVSISDMKYNSGDLYPFQCRFSDTNIRALSRPKSLVNLFFPSSIFLDGKPKFRTINEISGSSLTSG